MERNNAMITLTEKGSNQPVGQITEAQLQYLIDNLEEEWLEDQDYAITPLLLQNFEEKGADAELVSLLRNALGGREEIEIAWSK
jgi:processive 1,2-diacylglycerol beta-glucosyltransferase